MKDREAWCAAIHGVTNVRYDLVTEQQEEQGLTCGYEFEQILGDNEGQGSLECCSPWGR